MVVVTVVIILLPFFLVNVILLNFHGLGLAWPFFIILCVSFDGAKVRTFWLMGAIFMLKSMFLAHFIDENQRMYAL